MGNRIKTSEVQGLTGSTLGAAEISPYIDTANSIVDYYLDGKGLSEERLTKIELFLAAHLLTANRERPAIKESVSPASKSYSDIFGQGFESTTYGQTLMLVDVTGILARTAKKSINLKSIKENHS